MVCSVIMNPSLKVIMILDSANSCHINFFFPDYTMSVSKDFPLNIWFIKTSCSLSVPFFFFIFLWHDYYFWPLQLFNLTINITLIFTYSVFKMQETECHVPVSWKVNCAKILTVLLQVSLGKISQFQMICIWLEIQRKSG